MESMLARWRPETFTFCPSEAMGSICPSERQWSSPMLNPSGGGRITSGLYPTRPEDAGHRSPWPQHSALESETPSLHGDQAAKARTEAARRPGFPPSRSRP